MNNRRKILARASALSFGIAALSAAVPSHAATIILSDVGGVAGTHAELGFKIAAKYWESMLSDDVTVNIDVSYRPLGPDILGQAGSSYEVQSFADLYSNLAMDATSSLDAMAVANLRPLTGGALTMITPAPLAGANGANVEVRQIDNDGSANNSFVAGTTAGLRALGFATSAFVDTAITFSSDFLWDFDPTDGITAGTYDFIGVAVHEIGHGLGFTSGVDTYDVYAGPDGPLADDGLTYNFDNFAMGELSDIYRYSDPGMLNWIPGDPAYFSIDGGVTHFLGNAAFSTGSYNGDGWQASHWRAPGGCTNFIGMMNPYLCSGQQAIVRAQDIGVLDAIGWDLTVDALANPGYSFSTSDMYAAFYASAVPEPAAWLQMLLGFGFIGGALRLRRGERGMAASLAA